MATAKKSTRRGQHKLEFYAALEEIKDLYQNKGYVVYTLLYEHLKKKYNWEMSYITFHKYAKRELVFDGSKTGGSNRSSQVKTPKKDFEVSAPEKNNDGPPVAKANFKVGKKFNPHTVDIDPSRIL
jgi:Mn-containing catalase